MLVVCSCKSPATPTEPPGQPRPHPSRQLIPPLLLLAATPTSTPNRSRLPPLPLPLPHMRTTPLPAAATLLAPQSITPCRNRPRLLFPHTTITATTVTATAAQMRTARMHMHRHSRLELLPPPRTPPVQTHTVRTTMRIRLRHPRMPLHRTAPPAQTHTALTRTVAQLPCRPAYPRHSTLPVAETPIARMSTTAAQRQQLSPQVHLTQCRCPLAQLPLSPAQLLLQGLARGGSCR